MTSETQRYLSPLTAVASVLTIRPTLIRQKYGLARFERYHTLPQLQADQSGPLGCLHMAQTFRYFVRWRQKNIPPCTGSAVNTNYELTALFVGAWFRIYVIWISETAYKTTDSTECKQLIDSVFFGFNTMPQKGNILKQVLNERRY